MINKLLAVLVAMAMVFTLGVAPANADYSGAKAITRCWVGPDPISPPKACLTVTYSSQTDGTGVRLGMVELALNGLHWNSPGVDGRDLQCYNDISQSKWNKVGNVTYGAPDDGYKFWTPSLEMPGSNSVECIWKGTANLQFEPDKDFTIDIKGFNVYR